MPRQHASISSLNPRATEWYPPGYAHKQPLCDSAGTPLPTDLVNSAAVNSTGTEPVFQLPELPMEILSCVMSFLGACPEDLCSCLMTSKQLQDAVRSAPMSLSLTDRPRQLLSFPSQSGMLDQFVQALTQYMPGMLSCDLSTLPLEHTHISKLAQGLHNLEHLDLSGCKKLQPGVTQQLLQHLKSKRLQSINLQRCFQLTDACLTDMLEYTCSSNSSSGGSSKGLQCIALSHLNLAAWPALTTDSSNASSSAKDYNNSNGEATDHSAAVWYSLAQVALQRLPQALGVPLSAAAPAAAGGLRVLVLSNCNMLPIEGLLSLAVACPHLEYLFLGGSTLKAPWQFAAAHGPTTAVERAYVPPQVAAAAAAASGTSGDAGAAAQLPGALQQLADLLELPATLPWDILSSCCGPNSSSSSSSTGCGGKTCSCSCSCCKGSREHHSNSSSGGRSSSDDACDRASKRLHRSEPSAAAMASARSQALALAYTAALLPKLKAVEVTFMTLGMAGWLGVCIQRLQQLQRAAPQQHGLRFSGWVGAGCGSGCGCGSGYSNNALSTCRSSPKVWQLSCVSSVADALATLEDARWADRLSKSSNSTGGEEAIQCSARTSPIIPISPACLEVGLRCAANCSSRGRSTPLHMAADMGCVCHVKALLTAGAAVAARDASGASPMFVAAEAGQAAVAAALLEAGADCLKGNTAGETPLYIAALRGHLTVVELLLRHLSAANVDWTQRGLYGDAWTPLMAAAVANRVNVALCLLRAAAMRCCGQQPADVITPTAKAASGNGNDRSSGSSCSDVLLLGDQLQQGRSGASGTATACPGVRRLLAAENRYGQTVLHIAARKGCRELLQLLLCYGAGRVAGRVMDAAGDTPLDVARRHGHEAVVRELLQQC